MNRDIHVRTLCNYEYHRDLSAINDALCDGAAAMAVGPIRPIEDNL